MTGLLAAYRRETHPDNTVFYLGRARFTPVFGRDKELGRLRSAWTEGSTTLFSLQGDSGMGKSSLIRLWLQQLASEYWADVDALFVWCFPQTNTPAEQRAAIDNFLAYTLRWLQGEGVTLPPAYTHSQQIIERLRGRRVLLVLDNIPCLEINGKPELDIALLTFLQQLADNQQGMCLLAGCSVMPEAILELPNSEHMELAPLETDAAIQLLWRLGVQGDRDSLQQLAQQFGEYPATLALAAQYLLQWHDGDVHRADSIPIWYDPQSRGRSIRRVLAAYETWLANCPELSMLYFLPLFRRPFCREDLRAWVATRKMPWLSRRKSEAGSYENLLNNLKTLSEEDWECAWQRLLRWGLIMPYADGGHFEMQGVVGEYFTRQLRLHYPDVWETMHPAPLLQAEINEGIPDGFPSGEQLAVVLMRRAQYQDWLGASEISSLIGEECKSRDNMKDAVEHARQAVVYADLGMDLEHLQTKLIVLAELLENTGEVSEAQSLNEQAGYLRP